MTTHPVKPHYAIASFPAWRDFAAKAIGAGLSLETFLASCHPDNHSTARAAYLVVSAAVRRALEVVP